MNLRYSLVTFVNISVHCAVIQQIIIYYKKYNPFSYTLKKEGRGGEEEEEQLSELIPWKENSLKLVVQYCLLVTRVSEL